MISFIQLPIIDNIEQPEKTGRALINISDVASVFPAKNHPNLSVIYFRSLAGPYWVNMCFNDLALNIQAISSQQG